MPASDGQTPVARLVEVYGVDHSPWVQAVLLGLRERGIEHTLVSVPPVRVFRRSGILMPAARIDGGPWMVDSEKILVALGFPEVSDDDRLALRIAQGGSAMHRRNGRWEFLNRFGLVREEHPSWPRRHWDAFWRAFAAFYFFSVLTVARRVRGRPTAEKTVTDYATLQERLAPDAEFFGGAQPDIVDFQLFGIVQMLASIPGPPLDAVREDPSLERLRGWIGRMQQRFSGHRNLYSGPFFEPTLPAREGAPVTERLAFACGAGLMWLGFPVALATTIFYVRRVRVLARKRV